MKFEKLIKELTELGGELDNHEMMSPVKLKYYLGKYEHEYKNKKRDATRLQTEMYNPSRRLYYRARQQITNIYRKRNIKKPVPVDEILGIDQDGLWEYLDKGRWLSPERHHIDHIIPVSLAVGENELRCVCHYTNLRLITIQENMFKGNSLPSPELIKDMSGDILKIYWREKMNPNINKI